MLFYSHQRFANAWRQTVAQEFQFDPQGLYLAKKISAEPIQAATKLWDNNHC